MQSPRFALTCFILATLSLSCSLVDLRRSTDVDCTSEPVTFCTRLNDSQPPADPCQSWTCNKATRFCDLGPRDLDADGAIDPDCAPPGGTHPLDCDDTNADRFPDNPEVCDFIDNNCDNLTDENVYTVFDELTDDPNSMIPNTCPAVDCSDDQAVAIALAFASRPSASDPQVMATFIRPAGEANRGLLGAALFDAVEWRFFGTADVRPVFQPINTVPETLYADLDASAVSVTPFNDNFAFATTGRFGKHGSNENPVRGLIDGILRFETPPMARIGDEIPDKEFQNEPDDVDASFPVITANGDSTLSVYTTSNAAMTQLAQLQVNGDDSEGRDCSGTNPCLTTSSPTFLADAEPLQPLAVANIDEAGWIVALASNAGTKITFYRVPLDDLANTQPLAQTLDADNPVSRMVLARGRRNGHHLQLAIASIIGNHLAAHVMDLELSEEPPLLTIEHSLDVSEVPGDSHELPSIVWHSVHDVWVLGYLDADNDAVARLFAIRFNQEGDPLDNNPVQIFVARNLNKGLGFHFKPIAQGLVVLGYQDADQGNLIASQFGCAPSP